MRDCKKKKKKRFPSKMKLIQYYIYTKNRDPYKIFFPFRVLRKLKCGFWFQFYLTIQSLEQVISGLVPLSNFCEPYNDLTVETRYPIERDHLRVYI